MGKSFAPSLISPRVVCIALPDLDQMVVWSKYWPAWCNTSDEDVLTLLEKFPEMMSGIIKQQKLCISMGETNKCKVVRTAVPVGKRTALNEP